MEILVICFVVISSVLLLGVFIKIDLENTTNTRCTHIWSEPFTYTSKRASDFVQIFGWPLEEARMCTRCKMMQEFENSIHRYSRWHDLTSVVITGDYINFLDINKTNLKIKAYDYFKEPLDPTEEELVLFEMECGFNYKFYLKEIKYRAEITYGLQ